MSDLPELTDDERIRIIETGTNHPFWQRVLLPYLQEKAKSNLRALATQRSEDDDMKRGRFQAYEDIMLMPKREVDVFTMEQRRREQEQVTEREQEFRAEVGFHAPFTYSGQPPQEQ